MARLLNVALAQFRVTQSDPAANLSRAAARIEEAKSYGAEMVLFPEMWTTGFHWGWNREHAHEQEAVADEIAKLARRHAVWIAGSILLQNAEGKPANTFILFSPNGDRVAHYRKIHLFGMFQEQKTLAPGEGMVTYDWPWGKIGFSICYDLRFPELFRSYALAGVNLQILPAAFPQPRLEHWIVLLRARAIENQMYVLAVNQVGTERFEDESEATYFGASMIINPWGEVIAQGSETTQEILFARLDMDVVQDVRAKMPVFEDRRPDLYRL